MVSVLPTVGFRGSRGNRNGTRERLHLQGRFSRAGRAQYIRITVQQERSICPVTSKELLCHRPSPFPKDFIWPKTVVLGEGKYAADPLDKPGCKNGELIMALTVTEKEHWKNRISRRIDQTMQSLTAANDPGFLDRLGKDARKRALESLGLSELYERVANTKQQRKDLIREENYTYREMIATVKRCDIREVEEMDGVEGVRLGYSCFPSAVERAIDLRQAVHEKELLDESSMGRRILQLREEKEELLDTVWLATSGKQIRELWQKVTELLVQEPTALQAKALLIDPADGDPV